MAFAKGKGRAGKYGAKHQAQRKLYEQQLQRQGHLTCAQPTCLMRSRIITPSMEWAAGHDDTGTRYIGPVHRRCNTSDGARRGAIAKNAKAKQTRASGSFTSRNW